MHLILYSRIINIEQERLYCRQESRIYSIAAKGLHISDERNLVSGAILFIYESLYLLGDQT